ncbi:MAG: recombination mediator RecR [Oligoflexia bacterium]|nr:recombination mediator RecR [Oligoflexia bacterium]
MQINTPTDALSALVHELSRLPGIGEKSATRLAFHLLNADKEKVFRLADALKNAKEKVHLCSQCYTYTETDLCEICASPVRNGNTICIVERPSDCRAIESSKKYTGLYHVLHGTLSPVEGIGPEQIKVFELIKRINEQKFSEQENSEVVLALNPSVEGEATCLYISKLLKPLGIKISRIAYGLPMGGSLEYADRGTIGRAMENRVEC